jgi:hypothetical protein
MKKVKLAREVEWLAMVAPLWESNGEYEQEV